MEPWAELPVELIKHAEEHAKAGGDFDRRMALISFDNAIEVSIIIYLSLNPIQRDNQQFPREEVRKWEQNFHSKLRFLEHLVKTILRQPMEFERADIVFYHDLRNDLYHRGIGVVPELRHISGIRAVALWVFDTLFKTDAESLLAQSGLDSSIRVEVERVDQSKDEQSIPEISDQTKFLEDKTPPSPRRRLLLCSLPRLPIQRGPIVERLSPTGALNQLFGPFIHQS